MKKLYPLMLLVLLFSVTQCRKKEQMEQPPVFGIEALAVNEYIEMSEDEYATIPLYIFQPLHLQPAFTTTRPEPTDQSIYFAAAAAFTGKNLTSICGPYIIDGIIGDNFYKGNMNGFAAMWGDQLKIGLISDSASYYKQWVKEKKGDYFEQCLLVDAGETVKCTLFTGKTKRRALATKEGKALVIESKSAETIDDFSLALKAYGVESALYLDMGGWSYGWYKDAMGNVKHIGFHTPNTKHQTNWIVFRKSK